MIGYPREAIAVDDAIYIEGTDGQLAALGRRAGVHKRVVMIGHNPDMESLVRRLTGERVIMPTAALVRIDLTARSWSELDGAPAVLRFVLLPRELPPLEGSAS